MIKLCATLIKTIARSASMRANGANTEKREKNSDNGSELLLQPLKLMDGEIILTHSLLKTTELLMLKEHFTIMDILAELNSSDNAVIMSYDKLIILSIDINFTKFKIYVTFCFKVTKVQLLHKLNYIRWFFNILIKINI